MIKPTPSSSTKGGLLPPAVPLARLVADPGRLPPALRRMRELRHASTADELAFLVDEIWSESASESASASALASASASYGLSRLGPGDAVVDVGANVGLSAIYAAERVRVSGRDLAAGRRPGVVIALEPLPRTHAALCANFEAYLAAVAEEEEEGQGAAARETGEGARAQRAQGDPSSAAASSAADAAVSAFPVVGLDVSLLRLAAVAPGQPSRAELTTWPRAAGWATLCATGEDDAAVERDMLVFLRSHARAVAGGAAAAPGFGSRAMARAGSALASSSRTSWLFDALASAYVRRVLLAGRQTEACEARTLSAVLRERLPDRREVALLKVDVERAEMAVLRGVEREDWPRIRRVVVEASATVASGAAVAPSSPSSMPSSSSSSSLPSSLLAGAAAAAAGGSAGTDNLDAVVRLLREVGGFRSVEVAQAPALRGTSLFVVSAERGERTRTYSRDARPHPK